MVDLLTSRFFRVADPKSERFVFPLPATWWSRPYEYEWARRFCGPEDVALDAGCGIGHPFKFFLSDVCREVHACDLDPRILSPGAILAEVAREFGENAARGFPTRYFRRICYARASLTALPYEEGKFDKVYCISVLEHLHPQDIFLGLKEFERTLKDDGLILLTCDYPLLDPARLATLIRGSGLAFAGKAAFALPDNPLYSPLHGLHCFRTALRKAKP
ncbi:MAG: class I SAM-dependent methyltransferase [Desulfotomaculales bacterium]